MKRLILIILFSFVFLLTGCSNTVNPNPEGIKLTIDQNFIEYMPYEIELIPSFTFASDSNFNTVSYSKHAYQKILSNNDDFLVSAELSKLFTNYKDNIITKIDNQVVSSKTRMNRIIDSKIKKEKLLVDEEFSEENNRNLRVVYDEVSFILLENGLQLTVEYRRFTSGGITYYAWRYTRSVTFNLHYPLLVTENQEGKRELLILPLPNYTKYSVGPQLELKKLIEADTYLSSDYYNFNYPDVTNSQDVVKDFYINNHFGRLEAGDFICTYLGIDFKIDFKENSFNISKY